MILKKKFLKVLFSTILLVLLSEISSVDALAVAPDYSGVPKIGEQAYVEDPSSGSTIGVTITGCTSITIGPYQHWEQPLTVYFYQYRCDGSDYPGNPTGEGAIMSYGPRGWVLEPSYSTADLIESTMSQMDAYEIETYMPDRVMVWGTGSNTTPDNMSVTSAHIHEWVEGEIYTATQNTDGLEGIYCKTCGAIKESRVISAYEYSLYNYAVPMINAAKSGQTITFEFGEWNSFPKSFMEKLVNKSANGVTFVFRYKWNHKLQTITIPAGTPIDLSFEYCGPAKMAELYGMN